MNRKLKKLFPFPFKIIRGARVKMDELLGEKTAFQVHFEKAQQIYYCRRSKREESYRQFEAHALKALTISKEEENLAATAKALSLISRFQFEIGHSDCIKTLKESIVAAQAAYGAESKQAAIQMSGLCLKLDELGQIEEADEIAWHAFQMIEKNTSTSEKLSLNDAVIEVALAARDMETAVEAAYRGIRLTKLHVDAQSTEYRKRLQYYDSIIAP